LATDGVKREQDLQTATLNQNAAHVAEGFMVGANVGTFNFEALL
jgi:hypothetical protein